MKKPYTKPVLLNRGVIAAITANGNGGLFSPGVDPN